MSRYVTHAELDAQLDAWGRVRLRLSEHEVALRMGAHVFNTRNRLLQAIEAYAKHTDSDRPQSSEAQSEQDNRPGPR